MQINISSSKIVIIAIGLVIALVTILTVLFLSRNTQAKNELRAYENAMKSYEPAVVQNFLDMYRDASEDHRDSVKAHLEVLKKIDCDWERARKKLSRVELLRFIEQNPKNVHVKEAYLLVDSIDYVAATKANTPEALKKYMDEHEQGYYYSEASNAYEDMVEQAQRARQNAILDSIAATNAEVFVDQ